MKEICAIIRINKINETKKALADVGIPSITARKCVGRGKGNVEYLVYNEPEEDFEASSNPNEKGPKLMPKRMITTIVPDSRKDAVVQAIMKANSTGKPGDGKIFVMPILDAIRIRTGEEGESAIDEQLSI